MIRETGRNATRCNLARGAQHKENKTSFIRVIISITTISRMFFSNFFYNSPMSTVVIILPTQTMHMLRGKSLKVIFLWTVLDPSKPTSAEVHGVQSPGLLRQAGATHHLSWWYVHTETCWDEHVWFDFVNYQHSGKKVQRCVFSQSQASQSYAYLLSLAKKLEVCPR